MATQVRTLVFKVHNPSARTAATLHRSLRLYTDAARAVLGAAARDWAAVREAALYKDRLSGMSLARELNRRYRARTAPYPLHGSLRDALFADLAAALLSFDALTRRWERAYGRLAEQLAATDPADQRAVAALARRVEDLGDAPAFPSAPRTVPDERAYRAALDDFTLRAIDLPYNRDAERAMARAQADTLRDVLAVGTRPLFFPRPDGAGANRNFALLRTARDGRYYALLYLLPAGDGRARPLALPPPSGRRGAAIALHPAAAVAKKAARASCAVALPLACGAWHEEAALAEALRRPEAVRTARLFHRPEDGERGGFYLAVSFEVEIPDAAEPATWLAASQEEDGALHWALYDRATGDCLERGRDDRLVGLQMRWREERRMEMRAGRLPPRAHHLQAEQVGHATHILANALADLAARHAAQIGLRDTRYLRLQAMRAPPGGEGGARAPRTPAWHRAKALRNYRAACLVAGRLHDLLAYKCPARGVPPAVWVGGISPRDCIACGGRGDTRDACSRCGAPLGPENTLAQIARRLPEAAAPRRRKADDADSDLDASDEPC